MPEEDNPETTVYKLLDKLKEDALVGDLASKPDQIVPHILNGRLTALNMNVQLAHVRGATFDVEEAKRILQYTVNVIREIAEKRNDLMDVEKQMKLIWESENLGPLKEELGDFDPFTLPKDDSPNADEN